MGIITIGMTEIIGAKLIDFEVTEGSETASGADFELELTFDNGKEVIIYLHDDGDIFVEVD